MPNTKGHGLIIVEQEADHYFLGGGFIGTKEINPLGQWDKFLPVSEVQNRNSVETMNCSVYGTLNCIEILLNFHFHIAVDLSERFIGILAETNPNVGNNPHAVAECIRKNGLIEEICLPFDDSIKSAEEYYSPKPMITKLVLKGLEWLRAYDFKHEWVWRGNPSLNEKVRLISAALKRGPVGLSVYGWGPEIEGKYTKLGEDNHWVCCYGDTEKEWKIFDSYDNTHKLYSKESDIAMAKLYWVEKNTRVPDVWFVDVFKRLLNFISFK